MISIKYILSLLSPLILFRKESKDITFIDFLAYAGLIIGVLLSFPMATGSLTQEGYAFVGTYFFWTLFFLMISNHITVSEEN